MNTEIIDPRILSSATEKIKSLLQNISKNAYEIGALLNKVKKTEAWSLQYKSYDAWIQDLGLTGGTATSLAKIAKSFSKEEYLKLMSLGHTKLHLLSSAPKEDLEEISSKAERLSEKQLKILIKKSRASRGEKIIKKVQKELTKTDMVYEFAKLVASLPCQYKGKCILNESANYAESCLVHAARAVLEGKRLPHKLLRRIS